MHVNNAHATQSYQI